MVDLKAAVEKVIGRIRNIVSRAKRRKPVAGRRVKVFPDDVFIVSYPKSGNTWVRFLIANLLDQKSGSVDFSNIEQKVPDIYKNSNLDLLKHVSPRFLKSHEYLDPRYRKVIYIVRDPRDVVVSYFHYLIKVRRITEDRPLDQFIDNFIKGDISPFGSWYENVASWIYTRNRDENFLMMRYEDILLDTYQELQKIADFLQMSVDEDCLNRAIVMSSRDNMQQLEKNQSHLWVGTRGTRIEVPFVRSGKSGGWKIELPTSCANRIEESWGCLLKVLDYECDR